MLAAVLTTELSKCAACTVNEDNCVRKCWLQVDCAISWIKSGPLLAELQCCFDEPLRVFCTNYLGICRLHTREKFDRGFLLAESNACLPFSTNRCLAVVCVVVDGVLHVLLKCALVLLTYIRLCTCNKMHTQYMLDINTLCYRLFALRSAFGWERWRILYLCYLLQFFTIWSMSVAVTMKRNHRLLQASAQLKK